MKIFEEYRRLVELYEKDPSHPHTQNELINICYLPEFYSNFGLNTDKQKLALSSKHLYTMQVAKENGYYSESHTTHYHNLKKDTMLKIPELIENPDFVLYDQSSFDLQENKIPSSLVCILPQKNIVINKKNKESRKEVLVAYIDEPKNPNDNVTILATSFRRPEIEKYIERLIKKNRLLYINEEFLNGKKSLSTVYPGIQFTNIATHSNGETRNSMAFLGSLSINIRQYRENVNIERMKVSGLYLENIPDNEKTNKVCNTAFANNPASIIYFPDNIIKENKYERDVFETLNTVAIQSMPEQKFINNLQYFLQHTDKANHQGKILYRTINKRLSESQKTLLCESINNEHEPDENEIISKFIDWSEGNLHEKSLPKNIPAQEYHPSEETSPSAPIEVIGKHFETDAEGKFTLESFKEIARTMEIYSDKHYETARYLFVKDGQIMRHIAVSSQTPASTIIKPDDNFLFQLKRYAENTGSKIVFLHNHPSGYVEPSEADIKLTAYMQNFFKESSGEDLFAGHIILDHGTYGLYTAESKNWNALINDKLEPLSKLAENYKVQLTEYGMKTVSDSKNNISGQSLKQLSEYAKKCDGGNVWNTKNWIPAFVMTGNGVVTSLEYINNLELTNTESLSAKLKSIGRSYGSENIVFFPHHPEQFLACERYAQLSGKVKDIYFEKPDGTYETSQFHNGNIFNDLTKDEIKVQDTNENPELVAERINTEQKIYTESVTKNINREEKFKDWSQSESPLIQNQNMPAQEGNKMKEFNYYGITLNIQDNENGTVDIVEPAFNTNISTEQKQETAISYVQSLDEKAGRSELCKNAKSKNYIPEIIRKIIEKGAEVINKKINKPLISFVEKHKEEIISSTKKGLAIAAVLGASLAASPELFASTSSEIQTDNKNVIEYQYSTPFYRSYDDLENKITVFERYSDGEWEKSGFTTLTDYEIELLYGNQNEQKEESAAAEVDNTEEEVTEQNITPDPEPNETADEDKNSEESVNEEIPVVDNSVENISQAGSSPETENAGQEVEMNTENPITGENINIKNTELALNGTDKQKKAENLKSKITKEIKGKEERNNQKEISQKTNSKIATNFILEKLQNAGIEVVTDKDEFNCILESEKVLQKMTKSNITAESYFKASEEVKNNFTNELEKYINLKNKNPLELIDVGHITPVMKLIGIPDLPIKMTQSVVTKAMRQEPKFQDEKHGHELTLEELKLIPQLLSDPIMIFKSDSPTRKTRDSYIFFTEHRDSKGRSVIIPLAVNQKYGRLTINKINSIYGRNEEVGYVKENILRGNLVYFDKKRSLAWERECKVQFLAQVLPKQDSIRSILSKDNVVKFLDSSLENKISYFIHNNQTYGFTHNGKIYLDPEIMNSNVAVHEYTHLWDKYTQNTNPELWQKGKDILSKTHLWQEVKADPNYADISSDDDLVLSEVHSRICGELAQKVLERIAEQDGEITKDKVIDWDKEINEYIVNELKIKPELVEENYVSESVKAEYLKEFLSQPMKDLMNEVKMEHVKKMAEPTQGEKSMKFPHEDLEHYTFQSGDTVKNYSKDQIELIILNNSSERFKNLGYATDEEISVLKEIENNQDFSDEQKAVELDNAERFIAAKHQKENATEIIKERKATGIFNTPIFDINVTNKKLISNWEWNVPKQLIPEGVEINNIITEKSIPVETLKPDNYKTEIEQKRTFDSNNYLMGYIIRERHPEILDEIKNNPGNEKIKELLSQLEKNPKVKGVKTKLNTLLTEYAKENHPEIENEANSYLEEKTLSKSNKDSAVKEEVPTTIPTENIKESSSDEIIKKMQESFQKQMAEMQQRMQEQAQKQTERLQQMLEESENRNRILQNQLDMMKEQFKQAPGVTANESQTISGNSSVPGPIMQEEQKNNEVAKKFNRNTAYIVGTPVPKFGKKETVKDENGEDIETGKIELIKNAKFKRFVQNELDETKNEIVLSVLEENGTEREIKMKEQDYNNIIVAEQNFYKALDGVSQDSWDWMKAHIDRDKRLLLDQNKYRLNTPEDFFHNFEVHIRKGQASNPKEAMKIAAWMVERMAPNDRKRFVKMRKQLGEEAYDRKLLQSFESISKDRKLNSSELNFSFEGPNALFKDLPADVMELNQGEVIEGTKTKVGDSISMAITTRDLFEKKLLKTPKADFKILRVSKGLYPEDKAVLYNEKTKATYFMPLKDVVKHIQKVELLQNKEKIKEAKKDYKIYGYEGR